MTSESASTPPADAPIATTARLGMAVLGTTRFEVDPGIISLTSGRANPARMRQRMATAVSQLVAVGASAGGIDALSTLVSTLPEGFPAPVVIAQHLDPRRRSHLPEILSRKSALPVRSV